MPPDVVGSRFCMPKIIIQLEAWIVWLFTSIEYNGKVQLKKIINRWSICKNTPPFYVIIL